MGKRLLTLIMLCAFSGIGHTQIIPDLNKYKTATAKLEALATLCDTLYQREEYDQIKTVSHYAYSIIPPNNYYYLAVFDFNIGVAFEYQRSIGADSSLYYLERSLSNARKAKNPPRVREALSRLMYINSNMAGRATQSKEILKEILGIIDTTRSEKDKVKLYVAVSSYYSLLGQYETQIKYLLASITTLKKLIKNGVVKDREQIVADLMNLSELYISLNQPEKGIFYSLEARKYIVSNKTFLSHHYKDMTDVYLSMENVAKAKIYYDSVFKYDRSFQSVGSGPQ